MPCGSSKESGNQDKNTTNGHCAFEDLDHSALQQPLNLGVTNVKQILKCIQSGSREIKDIILNECNVIYECKACVGLFRSLANFLYHKRCYCKKHLCEDMLLFENFEEETVIVQPEPPKAKPEETVEDSRMADCTDLEKSDIAQEVNPDVSKDIKSTTETSTGSKDKNATSSCNKAKNKDPSEPVKVANPMISRRTRDKNAQNPVSSSSASKVAVKTTASEEPPLKCAKIIPAKISNKEASKIVSKESVKTPSKDSGKITNKETSEKSPTTNSKKDNQQETSTKEVKSKVEFSKFSATLGKNISQPFPKIIFKTIDSNPHAVYQSDDKEKLETFGIDEKYEAASVETKVDNDKLIIVLKKDAKSDSTVDAKTALANRLKIERERTNDFLLTRRKRLMARKDCDIHELRCLVCKTQFMSLKTLYYHMLSLHSKKRLYYPCPFCKTLFVQMYGVTRHLIAIHNKSKDQINKLRDVIKKKSVWKKIDDVTPGNDGDVGSLNYQIKDSPPREIPESPITTVSENDEPGPLKAVIKFGKNVTLHQCSKCSRVFGRKSSQVSHEKFCIMNSAPKTEGSDASLSVQTPPVVSFLSLSPKPAVSTKPPASILHYNKSEITPVKSSPEEKPKSDIKISIRPKRGAEKRMHKDFVNSQTLKWRSANRVDTNTHMNKSVPPAKKNTGKNLEKKVLSIMNSENLTCLKCDKKFSSYSNLRRHVAIHVGWTRFKCKFCDYQAYNKSQCWTHVQKTHSVNEGEIEKSIVNLVSTSSSKKSAGSRTHSPSSKHNANSPGKVPVSKLSAVPKVKISKRKGLSNPKIISPEKKHIQALRKDLADIKKTEREIERELAEIRKEKVPLPVPVQKIPKKDVAETKKEKPTITIQKVPKKDIMEVKKEKPHHIIPIQKLTIPDYKRETNYKSVTTSNPTTIILSKKIPSSTVQSIVTISPESVSSASKISTIRTSPRKNEIKGPGERLITTLVTRSSAYSKTTPIQIKLPARSNSMDELSKDSAENCSKKERLISEWFPKKDMSSSNVRRESAPLIIGLVPAGLNARVKNPGEKHTLSSVKSESERPDLENTSP